MLNHYLAERTYDQIPGRDDRVETARARIATAPERIDNWRNVDGNVWKNGTRQLCWRDNFWTPATAVAECDGALNHTVMISFSLWTTCASILAM